MFKATIYALALVVGLAPTVAAAHMQDPYPVNRNDNRTVFTAAVDTSLALVAARQVYAQPQVVAPAYASPVVYPASTGTTAGTSNPIQNVVQLNQPVQTQAGVGTNEGGYATAGFPGAQPGLQVGATGYAQQQVALGSSAASNAWTANLPMQGLVPASIASARPLIQNPLLVNLENSSSATYANALPAFYGAGAGQGLYTVTKSESYDAAAVYNRGLAQASGTYANSSGQFNNVYNNASANNSASSGQWVQSTGGWVQVGARPVTKGNIPWY